MFFISNDTIKELKIEARHREYYEKDISNKRLLLRYIKDSIIRKFLNEKNRAKDVKRNFTKKKNPVICT